jgi:hypothetical protein
MKSMQVLLYYEYDHCGPPVEATSIRLYWLGLAYLNVVKVVFLLLEAGRGEAFNGEAVALVAMMMRSRQSKETGDADGRDRRSVR